MIKEPELLTERPRELSFVIRTEGRPKSAKVPIGAVDKCGLRMDKRALRMDKRVLRMPSTKVLRLPSTKRSVPISRHFLRDALREWGLADQNGTAELLLSELVTNAVLYGCGDESQGNIRVVITRTRRQLVVAVGDTARRIPHLRQSAFDDESGRGMFLLEELALLWGACGTPQGKTVWFRLAL